MALILIVEDAQFTRNIIVKFLKKEGYAILEASNGREGLQVIRDRAPDCILLDLLMPDLNGLQVLEALQAEGSTIPVIVLTADIQQTTRQQCMNLGAFLVINKPPNRDELLAVIQKALALKEPLQ